MKVFHLKGLNGLRVIAALVVIGCHTSQRLGYHFLDEASSYGVTIFFALSGFLITLLLIKERERTNTISLKNFYIRRTVRIWPLYFLYIGLSLAVMYFVFAETYHFSSILPYLVFIPNYTIVFGKPVPIIWHFWSLGVEEQFYLFWPFLLSLFAPRFFSFTIS